VRIEFYFIRKFTRERIFCSSGEFPTDNFGKNSFVLSGIIAQKVSLAKLINIGCLLILVFDWLTAWLDRRRNANVKTVASVGSKYIIVRTCFPRRWENKAACCVWESLFMARLFVVSISLLQNRLLCNGSTENDADNKYDEILVYSINQKWRIGSNDRF
jgi:hypothetical protein